MVLSLQLLARIGKFLVLHRHWVRIYRSSVFYRRITLRKQAAGEPSFIARSGS
jgi:hypothetical protein